MSGTPSKQAYHIPLPSYSMGILLINKQLLDDVRQKICWSSIRVLAWGDCYWWILSRKYSSAWEAMKTSQLRSLKWQKVKSQKMIKSLCETVQLSILGHFHLVRLSNVCVSHHASWRSLSIDLVVAIITISCLKYEDLGRQMVWAVLINESREQDLNPEFMVSP